MPWIESSCEDTLKNTFRMTTGMLLGLISWGGPWAPNRYCHRYCHHTLQYSLAASLFPDLNPGGQYISSLEHQNTATEASKKFVSLLQPNGMPVGLKPMPGEEPEPALQALAPAPVAPAPVEAPAAGQAIVIQVAGGGSKASCWLPSSLASHGCTRPRPHTRRMARAQCSQMTAPSACATLASSPTPQLALLQLSLSQARGCRAYNRCAPVQVHACPWPGACLYCTTRC